MPKRSPDQVITHRIELGEYERKQIVAPLNDAMQAKAILSSAGILLLGGGVAFGAYTVWWLWDTLHNIGSTIKNVEETTGINPLKFIVPSPLRPFV